jgi:hypothetical protein
MAAEVSPMGSSTSPSFLDQYTRGLGFRVGMFAFLGLGWDVFMTFVQQLASGKIELSALCPASAWMVLAYSGIPLLVHPVTQLGRRFGLGYLARSAMVLLVFYAVELGFGTATRRFGIRAWDYRDYLDARWSYQGIVCWHPIILAEWAAFAVLIEWIDEGLRRTYPAFRAGFVGAWRER